MLSLNEKRARAAKFADEWKDAGYERGESQTFYNEFFEIFGIKRRRMATFEQPVKKLNKQFGFIDLFWKGTLLVEQKSAGRDLTKAKQQAFDYFPGLKEEDLPRFVLACDFQTFNLYDLDTKQEWKFGLQELPQKVQLFPFMDGGVQTNFQVEDKVSIKASELVGDLHDALKESGYVGHDLERFLVRLVFCMFADDTGIFEKSILTEYVETRTGVDGTDLGPKLTKLFEVLNTNPDNRQKSLDEDLAQFPYVNGQLFAEQLKLPDFNSIMRDLLLKACKYDWAPVSPAIFGSLFQSVMDKKKRRAIGAHYTNEANIMKVIGPLFLDGLKDELKRLKARKDNSRAKALAEFQERLSKLTFFDPACGCGNFLVITYREIRALETETIIEIKDNPDVRDLFASSFSKVDVDQFYGIEIEEFPALIAEIAMWMMDHIMNVQLSNALGEYRPRIPLKKSPKIVHADALEIDWATVLKPKDCSYVFGNPPFIGAKLQSDAQRAQTHRISNFGKKKGTLDFVCNWFLKAGAFVNASANAPAIGFVATNSISQGEQVAQLWPLLFDLYKLEIAFAHRTFAWGSEAKGKANVHVVIVGLAKATSVSTEKRLFDYTDIKGDPIEAKVKAISPYLFDAGMLADKGTVVRAVLRSPDNMPPLVFGSMPNDGGHLILDSSQADAIILADPNAKKFIREFIGADDLVNGDHRKCLWLSEAKPQEIRGHNQLLSHVEAVQKYRLASTRKATRRLATTPSLFGEIRHTGKPQVIIPRVSSENREYVPIGHFGADAIAGDTCIFMADAKHYHFSLITSRMHMSWLRYIGGRLKSDYRYSIGIVYNPFPWPDLDDAKKAKLEKLGQAILHARLNHPTSTMADLYDPRAMPPDLRKAHEANDKAVDQLYRGAAFASDRERVEFLLARYEAITAPALALAAQKPKRVKKQG